MSSGYSRSVSGIGLEVAVQSDEGIGGDLQVEVGTLGGDEVAQRVIEIKSHVPV